MKVWIVVNEYHGSTIHVAPSKAKMDEWVSAYLEHDRIANLIVKEIGVESDDLAPPDFGESEKTKDLNARGIQCDGDSHPREDGAGAGVWVADKDGVFCGECLAQGCGRVPPTTIHPDLGGKPCAWCGGEETVEIVNQLSWEYVNACESCLCCCECRECWPYPE